MGFTTKKKPAVRRSGRASRSPDNLDSVRPHSTLSRKPSAHHVQKATLPPKKADVIRRVVELRYTKATGLIFIKTEVVDPAGQSDEAIQARQQTFMDAEARLAPAGEEQDYLTNLPPPDYSYVDKKGRYEHPDNRFPMLGYRTLPRLPPPPPEHPKIKEARRRGTMTPEKALYYSHMPHHVNVPTAGIPKDENAPRRLKPPGPNFPGYQQYLQEQAKLRQTDAGQPTGNQHNEASRND